MFTVHQNAGFCFKWLRKKLRSRCLHLVCPALCACTGLIRPGLIITSNNSTSVNYSFYSRDSLFEGEQKSHPAYLFRCPGQFNTRVTGLTWATGVTGHIGPKSLILAPQDILDISGYQLGFGCQCVKAYNNENPVTNQNIL